MEVLQKLNYETKLKMETKVKNWQVRKRYLKQRCASLINSDLILEEDKIKEFFEILQLKLGITKEKLIRFIKEP